MISYCVELSNPDSDSISEEPPTSLQLQFPCSNPRNPHMRGMEDRVQTFDQRWPSHRINASIADIANAGFYFLGKFSCLTV